MPPPMLQAGVSRSAPRKLIHTSRAPIRPAARTGGGVSAASVPISIGCFADISAFATFTSPQDPSFFTIFADSAVACDDSGYYAGIDCATFLYSGITPYYVVGTGYDENPCTSVTSPAYGFSPVTTCIIVVVRKVESGETGQTDPDCFEVSTGHSP